MVGEGQLQLLDSLLHLGYVDQAFVKITVNVEQIVEGVTVVYQQIKEWTREFYSQHYILNQRLSKKPTYKLILLSQPPTAISVEFRIGYEFFLIVFNESSLLWIEGRSEQNSYYLKTLVGTTW